MWEIGTGGVVDGSPLVGSRGKAPVGGLGDEVPQKLTLIFLTNGQILTFWRNKLVKQSGFRQYTVRKKLWSGQRGGASPHAPPKYATEQAACE